jgi:hypothetical protein
MALSELQIALSGAGAVAVGAVWGYNKWQERSHRKLAERILQGGGQADVLLDSGAAAETSEPGSGMEPVLAGDAAPPAVDSSPSPWADDLADAVARLDFSAAVPAPALWAAQAEWSGHLGKALHWLGRLEGEWRLLAPHDAGQYASVLAAVQLADRRGAVTEAELQTFADGVRNMAAQLAGVAGVPDVEAMLERARALDEFCAGVDVQLGLHVVALDDAAFAGVRLRELAEAVGMQLNDDGRFHLADAAGETLYTLGNSGVELFDADSLRALVTRGVTLSLDVPNVPQGPAVFDAMVAGARHLAQELGGELVDAQRAPLTDEMIAAIRAKIEEIQARMAEQGIVAGSVRAQRLFS